MLQAWRCAGVGFRLIDKNSGEHANYAKGFEESTFCLAATGYGWGVRGKLSLAFGCIPVLIADDTQVREVFSVCVSAASCGRVRKDL